MFKYFKKALPMVIVLLYLSSFLATIRPMIAFKGPNTVNVVLSVLFLTIFIFYMMINHHLESRFLSIVSKIYIFISAFAVITNLLGIFGIILNAGNVLSFIVILVLESPFWGFYKYLSLNQLLIAQLSFFLLIFLKLKRSK